MALRWPLRLGGATTDPDAVYVFLKAEGIAYGRIPKAANSQMRARLAARAGLDQAGRWSVNQDQYWADPRRREVALLTGGELRRRYPDAAVFTVVRNPFDRLASCYRSKMLEETGKVDFGPGFARGMAFDAFVRRVAETPDRRANKHFRAQTSILFRGGEPKSLFVVRLDRLADEWPALRRHLIEARGFDIGPVPGPEGAPRPDSLARVQWTDELIALARERYRDDLARFFPQVEGPAAAR
ncbi:sulfotransferase family 2 domain-containing protein [Acuticoccus mangrovi]|uniref:Sulfotransferase family 2 domain-containing protein n=1 Tax=Acuticoccus mangrovi TaxID=2796142 RepID=A0A934MJZ9_9HYPH|nr:sulfotransferase family 2 domain-containing protein [Acuticoccus mangrovi]MBJ3775034.1 sulfotransferase family 2 domain-containing protein [Acuticoccus mangrovi]